MARMSRAESQAQTRSQLIATAKRLFFTDGYRPTSLEKVADAAGYSKGAVYSNFRNKDELCAAVLDEIRAERLAEVLDLFSRPDRFEALRDWAERVIGDPGWTPLEAEFALHARPNEELRTELAARWHSIIEMLADGLDSADGLDLKMPSREAAIRVGRRTEILRQRLDLAIARRRQRQDLEQSGERLHSSSPPSS